MSNNTSNSTQAISSQENGAGTANIDGGVSEENRKVLVWVAELLDPSRRESALMELSKKREQVPELALIIWHSFGMCFRPLEKGDRTLTYTNRRHDIFAPRDYFRLPTPKPISIDCSCIESRM